ncbi:MAG TPA: aerotolerance regulator BatA, partial [Marinilabiliaceae bacterium]|nr:aerotolerance regulator BatA [Marinilabiliaceae bacterium]
VGMAPVPINTVFGQQIQQQEVRIDEAMLSEIAEITGGQYFRATNKAALEKIYSEIDAMEKIKIEVQEYTRYSEEFLPFALLALLFLLLEIVLKNTVLRTLP